MVGSAGAPAVRLVLHQHPFASYCQKVLVALGELRLPFETHLVDDAHARAEHAARLWPMGGIPVLRDEEADLTLPESTTIIEYLDHLAPDGPVLVPADPAQALQARLWDRIVDQHIADQMGKIVTDRLRPEGASDPAGVEQARATLDTAYGVLDTQLAEHRWLAGETFTIADCAAAPALFYCWVVHRWNVEERSEVTRYYRDLMARPSVVRVIEDARPFREVFPLPWPDDTDAYRPSRPEPSRR
jgi:glutathione S-transferase